MKKLINLVKRFNRWEYSWLCLLVVIVTAMHFSIIMLPGRAVFDEAHYINDARAIIEGQEDQRPEHPTLSKDFVLWGMRIFGDNPLGWRFFPVMLGIGSIVLMYFICRQLSMSRRMAFLATFLLAFENLTFTFSSMAMLDVPCLTFTMLAFWLYLRGNYPFAGIAVGLSALCKLNGALAIIAIGLHWLIVRRDRFWEFAGLVIFAPVSFVFLMPLSDFFTFGRLTNPVDRIFYMIKQSGTLTFSSVEAGYAQKPIGWIFRYDTTPYTFDPNYFGVISYSVLALIVPAVVYMLYKAVKHSDAAIFGLSWFTATYLMWIPGVMITDRITYPFYIYPTVGSICIGLGIALSGLWRAWETKKGGTLGWVALGVLGFYLLAHVAVFAILSPISYWWGSPVLL
ncbi:MAG: phospholipid carrier-dependent glycosyltransferase [Dehalococcoidales bacterium]|nr:phospholipid carrier-dependent glycosyltransferase [Dehalococcoidales bacterium]